VRSFQSNGESCVFIQIVVCRISRIIYQGGLYSLDIPDGDGSVSGSKVRTVLEL